MPVVVFFAASITYAQGQTVSPAKATPFMGTWLFDMTNLGQGAQQTVRVWNKDGAVAASLKTGRFPAVEVTGVFMDGDLLILTTTLRENGAPIFAVIAMKRDGDTIKLAQMMEQSETIKRGIGRKQGE